MSKAVDLEDEAFEKQLWETNNTTTRTFSKDGKYWGKPYHERMELMRQEASIAARA